MAFLSHMFDNPRNLWKRVTNSYCKPNVWVRLRPWMPPESRSDHGNNRRKQCRNCSVPGSWIKSSIRYRKRCYQRKKWYLPVGFLDESCGRRTVEKRQQRVEISVYIDKPARFSVQPELGPGQQFCHFFYGGGPAFYMRDALNTIEDRKSVV